LRWCARWDATKVDLRGVRGARFGRELLIVRLQALAVVGKL